MPNNFIAHSSPKHDIDQSPHLYVDHIHEVERLGMRYAQEIFDYANSVHDNIASLSASLRLALRVHDVGKLEPKNQDVLSGKLRGKLPYDHVDGGVAVALSKKDTLAAWLIRAHHAPGLASTTEERALPGWTGSLWLRGCRYKRGNYERVFIEKHKRLIKETDGLLTELIRKHEETCTHKLADNDTTIPKDALTTRLLLSCLVDADHSDTARYYAGNSVEDTLSSVSVRWAERLNKLESHIKQLSGGDQERKKLRDELFNQCHAYDSRDRILSCAAPVGLGKTTAVLANLIGCARDRNLRRIFVIAPYTNIIKQTADKLRKILVLDGEDPNVVVGEHHHRVEFSSKELRQYTQLWKTPIVVTTAVQFFETLASASPSSLRKLHALPGSAIFVDECHACVPPSLMRQTWYWIKQLATHWSCHFVLASGSLVKFWESDEIVGAENKMIVPSIMSDDFFINAQKAEQLRVTPFSINDGAAIKKSKLLGHIHSNKTGIGSKLIILNTVQSAAVIAKDLQTEKENSEPLALSDRSVLHLSTALTPHDRKRIIVELEKRQSKNSHWRKQNWYLVATSCVEAGVDLDFDFGYRERCSVASFLQTAGRVNREGLNKKSAVYDFSLQEFGGITKHPMFDDSVKIFERHWGKIVSGDYSLDKLSTRALIEENRRRESNDKFVSNLYKREQQCDFQQVQEQFKIIGDETVTVIVDLKLQEQLCSGSLVSYQEIQNNSVQIWGNKIKNLDLRQYDASRGVYFWNYGYDADVLGYMSGYMEL